MDYVAQVLDVHAELRSCGYRPTRVIIEKGKWQQRWKEGRDKEHDGSRSMLWLDLQNFYPTSLRLIARWLSLPYPCEADVDESWLQTREGSQWRCTVTLRALQQWLDFRNRFDLGYFSATLAGQAFNAYRHRFMTTPIYVHCHADVEQIETEAHYGGRIEARFLGRAPKGDYAQVDVTSFYASVMHGNRFPTKQIGHSRRIGLRNLRDLADNYCVIARVELATESPAYPRREGGSVHFPIGRFSTTLCTPEIQQAFRRGDIARCDEVVVYESAPIFDVYVEFFWDLRQRAQRVGDELSAQIAKRFLTAVFGKFGQRIWLQKLIRDDAIGDDRIWREFDWQDDMEYEYRLIAGRLERSVRDVLGRDSLVAIPAHVTSYGRVALWELMEKAGREHVYYVDTDSLIGSRIILQNLGDKFANKQLGGLRLVKSSSHLFIRGPKWYVFGDKVARAGVPENAREVAWNVFDGEQTQSMKYHLSHDSLRGAIVEGVRIVGPLTERLSLREQGRFVAPQRLGDASISAPGGALVYPLPHLLAQASETAHDR
jgi:hypothetical protein